jgi:hypothetical protein
MAPKKSKATPETPAMTQAAIRKLVRDSIAEALEVERAEVAARRECIWKDFKISDPIKFKGTEGAVALIRWFEKTENLFLMCGCPDVSKVKFATGMLLDEAMSWWNSYAQPIGMENAYKLTWDQFKKLITKKFCPRTEVQKLETEFYELVTKGDDIETYIRNFQELVVLCPTMVPDDEKKMENFIVENFKSWLYYVKPVDKKQEAKKPNRWISTGRSFSQNETSAASEKKTTPRSYLGWIPMGKVFNTFGLRWIPTGKILDSCNKTNNSDTQQQEVETTTTIVSEHPQRGKTCTSNTVICAKSSSVDAGTCESDESSYTQCGKEFYANIACGNPFLIPLLTPLLLVQA